MTRRLAACPALARFLGRVAPASIASHAGSTQIPWRVSSSISQPDLVLNGSNPDLHQLAAFFKLAHPLLLAHQPVAQPGKTDNSFAAVVAFPVLLLDHLL